MDRHIMAPVTPIYVMRRSNSSQNTEFTPSESRPMLTFGYIQRETRME